MRTILAGLLIASTATPAAWAAASLSPELLKLQSGLYQDSIPIFQMTLASDLPPEWQKPEMKDKKDALIAAIAQSMPAFNPAASRLDWLTGFEASALAAFEKASPAGAKTTAEMVKLKGELDNAFTGYSENKPYGKFLYLTPVADTPVQSAPQATLSPMKLLAAYPSPHTIADLNNYIDARFARHLVQFLATTQATLYAHDSDCADAIRYHRAQGFTEVTQYAGTVDNQDPPNFLAYNPKTQKYAFGVCDLIGQDDVTRIAEILGPVFQGNGGGFAVHHAKPESLFAFNAAGKAFKFQSSDRVIMGYQNTVWWALYDPSGAPNGPFNTNWKRIPLTEGGVVEADLFENPSTNERIYSVANCYGDEMKIILNTLYKKGARRFAYLGTGGGLPSSLNVGDVLIPTTFQIPSDPNQAFSSTEVKNVPFANDALKMNIQNLPHGSALVSDSVQGWVPTLIEESVVNMITMRDVAKAQALDIETRYIGEFFSTHPALETTVIITISDLPFGGPAKTFDNGSATRSADDASVDALIPQLLSYKAQ